MSRLSQYGPEPPVRLSDAAEFIWLFAIYYACLDNNGWVKHDGHSIDDGFQKKRAGVWDKYERLVDLLYERRVDGRVRSRNKNGYLRPSSIYEYRLDRLITRKWRELGRYKVKVDVLPVDQINKKIKMHGKIARRIKNQKTGFQRRLLASNRAEFEHILRLARKKKFRLKNVFSFLPVEDSEVLIDAVILRILSGIIALSNCWSDSELLRYVYESEIKVTRPSYRISPGTTKAAARLLSLLKQDLGKDLLQFDTTAIEYFAGAYKQDLAIPVDEYGLNSTITPVPMLEVVNLSMPTRRLVIVREIALFFHYFLDSENSEKGRCPADLVSAMLSLLGHEYELDLVRINAILSDYDAQVLKAVLPHEAKPNEYYPFSERMFGGGRKNRTPPLGVDLQGHNMNCVWRYLLNSM